MPAYLARTRIHAESSRDSEQPRAARAWQAASGAGAPGMEELKAGTMAMAKGGKAANDVFAHPLPFNVIPHIDKFLDDRYTKEERKARHRPPAPLTPPSHDPITTPLSHGMPTRSADPFPMPSSSPANPFPCRAYAEPMPNPAGDVGDSQDYGPP